MVRYALILILLVSSITTCNRALAEDKVLDDAWDAIFIGKDKVGYVHSLTSEVAEDGEQLIAVKSQTVMSIKRFGQTIRMEIEYKTFENKKGEIVKLESVSKISNQATKLTGKLDGDVMKLTLRTPGKETNEDLAWDSTILGPYAQDALIRSQGIEEGKTLTFKTFMPDLNKIMTTTLLGQEMEEVELLGGEKRKLRKVQIDIEGFPVLKSFSWVTDQGETLKSRTQLMNMVTHRVTKEVALAEPSAISADFGLSTLVKVNKDIPKPYDAKEVVYQVELEGAKLEEVLPQDARQKITKGENGETLLTVRTINPEDGSGDVDQKTAEKFLKANNYLQSDDPLIIELSKKAVGNAEDAWEKARRIEKWVFENMTEKNFSLGFATAAEVASDLQGDCTEHGVLLAAMARAAGIPARAAVGLVYANRLQAFGYHMWAEVLINGNWIPLDATLGRGHASPTHIKIADSALDGVAGGAATSIPVAQVLGKLKLHVVSFKH